MYPERPRLVDTKKGYGDPDRRDLVVVPRIPNGWGSPGGFEPSVTALRDLEVGITVELVVLALDVADEAATGGELLHGHADQGRRPERPARDGSVNGG